MSQYYTAWVVKSAECGLSLSKAKHLIQSNKTIQPEKIKSALEQGITLDPIHILHFNHLQLYLLSFGIL
jgi:hypothetical protein